MSVGCVRFIRILFYLTKVKKKNCRIKTTNEFLPFFNDPYLSRLSYLPVPPFADTRKRTILLVPCFRCTRFLTKAGKEFLLKINPILLEEREIVSPFCRRFVSGPRQKENRPGSEKKLTTVGCAIDRRQKRNCFPRNIFFV